MNTETMQMFEPATAPAPSRRAVSKGKETPDTQQRGGWLKNQVQGAWGNVVSIVEPLIASIGLALMLLGAIAVWLGCWPGFLWMGLVWGLAGLWLAHELAVAPLYEDLPEWAECHRMACIDIELEYARRDDHALDAKPTMKADLFSN